MIGTRNSEDIVYKNKRIRCNEYIASLLSKEFSKRLNRIISMGDRATIESMRELVI